MILGKNYLKTHLTKMIFESFYGNFTTLIIHAGIWPRSTKALGHASSLLSPKDANTSASPISGHIWSQAHSYLPQHGFQGLESSHNAHSVGRGGASPCPVKSPFQLEQTRSYMQIHLFWGMRISEPALPHSL